MKRTQTHPLITGTIILTMTGLISRLMGFFYRIYLSRIFGEEGMGIYQLTGPVLSISYSLTSAAFQTAISKLVAENTAKRQENRSKPLIAALFVSLPLSILCNYIVYFYSDFIAYSLLAEPRTASMLRILSFAIPITCIHSCINGYFYGIQKTTAPAASQLLEQCIRVGCVYCFSTHAMTKGMSLTINVAALGLVLGEIGSLLVSIVAILYRFSHCEDVCTGSPTSVPAPLTSPFVRLFRGITELRSTYQSLFAMVLPLTANRIVLNLLQSIESVSIPAKLRLYGYDTSTALSVYGVLTGMAMPLIFFPNALTSSVSVLLLPMISEAYAAGNHPAVRKYTQKTIFSCILMGIGCMITFLITGRFIGSKLFDSDLAGHFILTLSFLCPFLYLDTTLSSILQGLGKAGHIFAMNVASLLLRLLFIHYAIPIYGISGYLWGILAGQILLSILYLTTLLKTFRTSLSS